VEWMGAVTVLLCGISDNFAIPVSTTHCQVGRLPLYGLKGQSHEKVCEIMT
jgi:hypothetical protein